MKYLKFFSGYIAEAKWEEEEDTRSIGGELEDSLPLVKNSKKKVKVAFLQTILKRAGLLKGKSGPLADGVDGDFGGKTEAALKEFIGKGSLKTTEDIDEVDTQVEEKGLKVDEIFSDYGSFKTERKKQLGLPLENQGVLQQDYDNFFSKKSGFPSPSGNINDDVFKYVSFKEGGITDDPRDTSPSKSPMPYLYNTQTRELTLDGQVYKVAGTHLPPETKSIRNETYASDLWHTNRGIVWKYWGGHTKNMSALDRAKAWLNMTDENVKMVYKNAYNKATKNGTLTKSYIANHFLGLIIWGSGNTERFFKILNPMLKEEGYATIDAVIDGVSERRALDLMVKARLQEFKDIGKPVYLKGWSNSVLNFHNTYVNHYLPLASEEDTQT